MTIFLNVLTLNILPILLVASFGYVLRRRFDVHLGTLNNVVFNILTPCLVFSSLVDSQLPGDELLELAGFTVLSVLATGALGYGLARLLRLGRTGTAALLVTVMFVNAGNYGLTLLQLRYGDDGLARGVVYYIFSTVLLYTVGVFIASTGQLSWRDALRRMTRVPAVYAALLAMLVYGLQIPVPQPILSGITVAGAGAIPVLLLILGMQIADLDRSRPPARFVWPAVSVRLLGGPLVGVIVAAALGLSDQGRGAMIIESSMPPAVANLVVAAQFGLPSDDVARIVVFATLLSPLTIAATITLLGL